MAKERLMTAAFRTLAGRLTATLCYQLESGIEMALTVRQRKALVGRVDALRYTYPGGTIRFPSHSTRTWKTKLSGMKDLTLRSYRILAIILNITPTQRSIVGEGNVEKCKLPEGHNDWFIDAYTLAHAEGPTTEELPTEDLPTEEESTEPTVDLSNLPPETLAIWDALKIGEAVAAAMQSQAPALIEEVRKNIQVIRHEVLHPNGDVHEIEGLTHERFGDCLDVLRCSKQENRWLWLFGEAGTGKTFLGKQLASALRNRDGSKKRFASISSHTGMSPSEFFGWLLPTGDGGKFEHVEAIFVDYVENGGCFFIDECANLPPDALTRINSLLSNLETWLPKRMGNEHLKMSPDFSLLMADNTVGRGSDDGYVRNVISAETRSRFQYIKIGYDRTLEEGLFGHDKTWLKACWSLRDKLANGANTKEMVSSRFISQGLDLRGTHGKDAYPVERCIYRLTEGWSDNDLTAMGITKYTS